MYPYSYSKGEISMLNQDYTAKLLNLEDIIITNVENICEELHISIELPRKKHICPACGSATDYVHDYRMQTIKDVPLARNTFLHLRKRRYRCTCGKRFFEKNTFCLAIIVSPAGWWPKSSMPLKRSCPPKRSAVITTYPP